MSHTNEKITLLTQHFLTAGTTDYIGEPLSQIEHALQAAYFAEQSGHSEDVILASLLHDIGHFFSTTEQHHMADLGIVYHEWIGAKLAYDLNFSAKVALLIGYHVDAKRYLARKKPLYLERLSSASLQTLAHQGGPMEPLEMVAFEQLPYFKEILQVRINDEKAKEVDLRVPDFNFYQPRIQHHMKGQDINRDSLNEAFILTDYITPQWVAHFKAHLQQRTEAYQPQE